MAKNGAPKVIWSQKDKGLPNFGIEISESPKMYRILQDFGGTRQLRDNAERQHGKLFRFRKKFLKVHNLNIQNHSKLHLRPRPPLYP